MSDAAVTIIVAIFGSGGLIGGIFSVINTAIARKAARSDKQQEIESEMNELKKETQENKLDLARIQLMLLISDYPDDVSEIMTAAERYFKTLGGNFYMDTLFSKWLKAHKLEQPSWFGHRD